MVATHPERHWSDFPGSGRAHRPDACGQPVCQITLFLVVEHPTDSTDAEGAVLVVDSLDLAIVMPDTGTFTL